MIALLFALFTITAGPDRSIACRPGTICRLQVQGGMTWMSGKDMPRFHWELVSADPEQSPVTAILERAGTLTPVVVANGPSRWRVELVASDGRDIQIDEAVACIVRNK